MGGGEGEAGQGLGGREGRGGVGQGEGNYKVFGVDSTVSSPSCRPQ